MARGRHAVTLVEVLVALALVAVLVMTLYAIVRFFFSRQSKSSLVTMTDRVIAQKDIRIGLRKLIVRIREGTEILEPEPDGVDDLRLLIVHVRAHRAAGGALHALEAEVRVLSSDLLELLDEGALQGLAGDGRFHVLLVSGAVWGLFLR